MTPQEYDELRERLEELEERVRVLEDSTFYEEDDAIDNLLEDYDIEDILD